MKFADAVILILLSATNGATAQSAKVHGRLLFEQKGCPQCHSYGGVGGAKGPALDAVGKRLRKDELERQILGGGMMMPSFQDALTPEELNEIVEFLRKSTKSIVPAQRR